MKKDRLITKEDEVKVCNCANCDKLLLGESMEFFRLSGDLPESVENLPGVGGRIDGRPWCDGCLRVPSCGVSKICGGATGPPDDDIGSYRTIAVRALEEGQ